MIAARNTETGDELVREEYPGGACGECGARSTYWWTLAHPGGSTRALGYYCNLYCLLSNRRMIEDEWTADE